MRVRRLRLEDFRSYAQVEVALEDGNTVIFGHAEGERRRPKRFLIDGAAKRALELAGELRVVAFFPEEVTLLCEAPSARRRYLDALIGQVDRRYRREALELQRVLEQRNALLRAAREEARSVAGDEIAFWDDELVRLGAAVAARRMRAVDQLAPLFAAAYERLASRADTALSYQCQVARGDVDAI